MDLLHFLHFQGLKIDFSSFKNEFVKDLHIQWQKWLFTLLSILPHCSNRDHGQISRNPRYKVLHCLCKVNLSFLLYLREHSRELPLQMMGLCFLHTIFASCTPKSFNIPSLPFSPLPSLTLFSPSSSSYLLSLCITEFKALHHYGLGLMLSRLGPSHHILPRTQYRVSPSLCLCSHYRISNVKDG